MPILAQDLLPFLNKTINTGTGGNKYSGQSVTQSFIQGWREIQTVCKNLPVWDNHFTPCILMLYPPRFTQEKSKNIWSLLLIQSPFSFSLKVIAAVTTSWAHRVHNLHLVVSFLVFHQLTFTEWNGSANLWRGLKAPGGIPSMSLGRVRGGGLGSLILRSLPAVSSGARTQHSWCWRQGWL